MPYVNIGIWGPGNANVLREQLRDWPRHGRRRIRPQAVQIMQRRMRECPSSIDLTFDGGQLYTMEGCITFPLRTSCAALLQIPDGVDPETLEGVYSDLIVGSAPGGSDQARMITLRIGEVLNVTAAAEMTVYGTNVPVPSYARGSLHMIDRLA